MYGRVLEPRGEIAGGVEHAEILGSTARRRLAIRIIEIAAHALAVEIRVFDSAPNPAAEPVTIATCPVVSILSFKLPIGAGRRARVIHGRAVAFVRFSTTIFPNARFHPADGVLPA